MNHTINQRNLRLLARNEGKIKSYESCSDVRAWSHDVRARNRYLREWIKRDMPISVIPVSTLAGFLRTMTYKTRGRAMPRCHPDCKSKVLLESISDSCHMMKECLTNDQNFEKYFEEEEFETSHWPCERCLDALKSIKMFWKIIVEKIFNINIPKNEEFELQEPDCTRTDSVRSVAKVWQNEMVHQALFIKNITPLLRRASTLCHSKEQKCSVKNVNPCNKNSHNVEYMGDSHKLTNKKNMDCSTQSLKSKTLDYDSRTGIDSSRTHSRRSCRKLSRCTSVRVKLLDVGCDTCNIEKEDEEIKAYKNNIEYLQEKFNGQTIENERLKQENTSLKLELQNVYKSCPRRPTFYNTCFLNSDNSNIAPVPEPFDNCIEQINPIKNTDSEMIITMKNCKNETYRHVSVLQVLHKTNDPVLADVNIRGSCCRKEDPIDLLAKVQTTFSAIVRREIGIASGGHSAHKSDIEASFQRVNASKSPPSCSTISAFSTSSESNFVSTKDMSDIKEENVSDI